MDDLCEDGPAIGRRRAKDGRCEPEAYKVARLLRMADESTARHRREAAGREQAAMIERGGR